MLSNASGIRMRMSAAIPPTSAAIIPRTALLIRQRARSDGEKTGTRRYAAPQRAGGPKKSPRLLACAAESARQNSGGLPPREITNLEMATVVTIALYIATGTPNSGVTSRRLRAYADCSAKSRVVMGQIQAIG